MRRAKEVQVVFKDCQTRAAKIRMRQKRAGTSEGQWRRAMAKGTVEGEWKWKWKWKRTMTKNVEDGAPALDGRGVTAG